MPRLCAFLLLASMAVAASRPRAKARPLTPAECRLLFMRSPSKAVH